MTLSAWWLPVAAIPILLLGEFVVRRLRPLSKANVPVAVVGGLIVAGALLAVNLISHTPINIATKVSTPAWTWLITPEPEWHRRPELPVYLPLSTAFFTCVGLNASWSVAKRGSWQLLLLLVLATLLGVVQNFIGVAMCGAMHVSKLLGLLCGSVTLTGGPSTALGFADEFEKAGFHNAGTVGAAAAMFGIICSSIFAGWMGGQLIQRLHLKTPHSAQTVQETATRKKTFLSQLAATARLGRPLLTHVLILLICIKAGAWASFGLRSLGLSFPVYIGAMICGIVVRNALDAAGKPLLTTPIVNAIAGVCLGLFLAMAMAGLNLLDLRSIAGPMIAILVVQVFVTLLFAGVVTFVLTGRDYEAAVTAAGHVGFGLGITPNAVATMDSLEQKFGPAPEAMLIVTIVGAFLIDFTNALIITVHLNFLRGS